MMMAINERSIQFTKSISSNGRMISCNRLNWSVNVIYLESKMATP